MPDRYRLPGSPDWNDTAFWSTTRYGVGGSAAPVTGDSVYIMDGADAITSNITGHAAVDLELLYVGPQFTGSIGGAGAALTIAVSNSGSSRLTIDNSPGAFFAFTAGTNGIDLADIRLGSVGGNCVFAGGTVVTILGGKTGSLNVQAACVLSTSIKTAGCSVRIEDNATDIPTGRFSAGQVVSYRDIDTVFVGRNAAYTTLENVTVDGSITVEGLWNCQSTGTVASLVLDSTGNANANGGPGCTITAAEVYEGASYFVGNNNMTLSATTRVGNIR